MEKKLAREGVGALNEAQLGALRGAPTATVTKVEVLADRSSEENSRKRSSEVLQASTSTRPTSVARDEELDLWLALSVGDRARKWARSFDDKEVTRSQVRLTAGSGSDGSVPELVVEAAASYPVTARRPERPVWGSACRR